MTEVFIIVKPDAIERGLTDIIIQRFMEIGEIEWITGKYKSRKWCRQHYEHIVANLDLADAYAVMETFMSKTLLIGFLIRGNNCIERARELAGSTNVLEANIETIRGEYAVCSLPICHNLIHVADSPKAVKREVRLFMDRSTDHDFKIH